MSNTVSNARSHESDAPPRPASPLLDAADLSKRYGAVQALDGVALRLGPGEIHALVGENGSGKSTLVGIVSGTVAKDSGSMSIDGTELTGACPRKSQQLGAVTVFQDGSLISELSVGQNLYLGTPVADRPPFGRIDSWARQLLAEYSFDIDPSLSSDHLPPGDRQLIEIVRAVASRPKILILDEATSALDPRGVNIVLDLMRRVAASGSAVLFVTHRLSEVMRVAQTVTVLRDGKYQGTHDASKVTPQDLVELMAGTRVELEFPARLDDVNEGEVLLTAQGLAGAGFGPIEVELRQGQIIGIAGADGNGQLPFLRSLARHAGDSTGSVFLGSREIDSYPTAVSAGVVYLSSNRRVESLFGGLTITDNLGMGVLAELSYGGVMRTRRERRFVAEAIDRYRIRVGHAGQSPIELSGGNQQKVALSRVLAMRPKVLLIDEPTQGVDVRSRLDIYRFLREIAEAGSAVVVVSSDASELAGLCDRILVMSRGRLTTEIVGKRATEESIVSAFAVEHELAATDEVDGATAASQSTATSLAPTRGRRLRLSPDGVRITALVALVAIPSVFAQSQNSTFLTTFSIYNVLLLVLPLIVVAAAEYVVLMTGGIDVSVGATMTLAVVLVSFWVQDGSMVKVLLMAAVVVVFCAVAVGGVNAVLIEKIGLPAVIATIAMLGVAGGMALVLRPTAGGLVSPSLTSLAQNRVGPVPISLIVLVIVLAVVDISFRRTGFGLRVRAVGLNGVFAQRLGIATGRVRAASYVICSALAALAGVVLAAQIGVGDPSAGNSFTLLAIAAPVLGGAALSGGRGTLVGAAMGSLILVISQSLVTVLGMSDGTSYVFTGALTLLALLSSTDSLQLVARYVRPQARPQGK